VIPSTPADAKGLLTSCIEDDDPCVFVESMRLLFVPGPVPAGEHRVPLGRAAVPREGSDVAVITWGWQVPHALSAAEALASEGTSVEVVDLRTLVPLDRDTVLESVAKTKRAVIVHAATQFAGPGAELAAMLQRELWGQLDAPVERLGGAYAPPPYAVELERALYPDAERIADRIRSIA
jgi:pyruvate/2-oxoglutarate/acetoin dehydrogenase E1 component